MDLRVGREDAEGAPWSVLSDLAITIVLVLVVYIVLQFVQTFRERAINSELAKRQREVRDSIQAVTRGSWDVQIDSLAPDRQRVTFSSEVLFETCRATLRGEGVRLLEAVGGALGHEARYLEAVQVEGHTDRRPIRAQGTDCPYRSNWELSSARATRVVALFSAESLVANPKLSAIGRAEYHPVDTTALAPNRRIDIILQYDRRGIAQLLMGDSTHSDSAGSTGDRSAPHVSRANAPAPVIADPGGSPASVTARHLGPVADTSWFEQPAIQAISGIYETVDAELASGAPQGETDTLTCRGVAVTYFRSPEGAVRMLTTSGTLRRSYTVLLRHAPTTSIRLSIGASRLGWP